MLYIHLSILLIGYLPLHEGENGEIEVVCNLAPTVFSSCDREIAF